MVNYKRVVLLAALAVAARAAPAADCESRHYDQRQNGTENYRLNIDGVVIAVAPADSLLAAASELDISDLLDLDNFEDFKPSKPDDMPVKPLLNPKPQQNKPDAAQESKPQDAMPQDTKPESPAKPAESPLSDVSLADEGQKKDVGGNKKHEKNKNVLVSEGLVACAAVKAAPALAGGSDAASARRLARRPMLLLLCLLAAASAAPASYDQRQQGDFNVQADVQNVMLLVLLPQKKLDIPFGAADLLGDLLSSTKSKNPDLQDRADIQMLEAFVKPDAPYKVEIGESDERSAAGGRQEVLIAARRRPVTVDAQTDDEFKLLGATEQCGPGRRRNAESLMCQDDPAFEQALKEQPEETPLKPIVNPAPAKAAKPIKPIKPAKAVPAVSLPAPLKPSAAPAPLKPTAAPAPEVVPI